MKTENNVIREKFRNHYNFKPGKGVKCTDPQLTIENQSYTVAELLYRMQGGLGISVSNMQYPENEDDMQIRVRDLTDIDLITNELADTQRKVYLERVKIEKKKERDKLLAELEQEKDKQRKEQSE